MAEPTWRWGAVAAGVAALMALPALAGALPARDSGRSAEELLAKVRASGTVGWSGYGESRGTLVLPDVRELSDLGDLVGGTTRVRAWWRGPREWRVNALSLVGETDTTRDRGGGWTWHSADRRALRLVGDLDVRLPAAADLLAPTLGRRLAGTEDVTVRRLPARRVAGMSAAGLRLVPRQPALTTVHRVDLWVEPDSGLPLQVEVRVPGHGGAEGGETDEGEIALQAGLLEVDLAPPAQERTRFSPPARAQVTRVDAPDLAAAADRFAPYVLPDELAGLPRRPRSALSVGGGVGTYGDGFTAVALVPLPEDLARSIIRRVDPGGNAEQAAVSTPLVSGLIGRDGRGRAFLAAGTVPPSTLSAALAQLRVTPPARRTR